MQNKHNFGIKTEFTLEKFKLTPEKCDEIEL